MGRQIFNQIMLLVSTVLLILLFFFPDSKAVKEVIFNRVGTITLILVIGLYLKDMFKS